MTPFRMYQLGAVNLFETLSNKRLILAHATGAGKTRTALECAIRLSCQSVLVIGSAQSRGTWVHEAKRWWPEVEFHSILWGKANKSLTKKDTAAREAAYSAPFQIVSYSLLGNLAPTARDLLIIDEAHALKNPQSQQSRTVKEYVRQHSQMPILLLTATPIPNEVQDIWNLVDTLVPGYLGDELPDGGIPWSFKRQYCEVEEGWEGRKNYFGANKLALPRLRAKLEPIMHRVSSAEVAAYTPKLNASILWIDDKKVKDADIAKDWLEARSADESTHIGLFAWTHVMVTKLGAEAFKAGWETVYVTGNDTPEQRQALLSQAKAGKRVCVVGTAGSLAESISLSFIKQALVFEWRATPGQALQFSGRFARQDSETMDPVCLQYVARTDDEQEATVLRERLEALSELYEQDSRAVELREIMQPREMTESRLEQLAANMFSDTRLSLLIQETDDE